MAPSRGHSEVVAAASSSSLTPRDSHRHPLALQKEIDATDLKEHWGRKFPMRRCLQCQVQEVRTTAPPLAPPFTIYKRQPLPLSREGSWQNQLCFPVDAGLRGWQWLSQSLEARGWPSFRMCLMSTYSVPGTRQRTGAPCCTSPTCSLPSWSWSGEGGRR